MNDRTATLILNFDDGTTSPSFRVLSGHDRPGRGRHPHAVRQDRACSPTTRASCRPRLQLGDHLHRRRQGRAAVPRLPDRAARACTATSSRSATCCSTASCRRATQKEEFDRRRHAPHDGERADARFFMRGFRRDAHPMAVMIGVVGALSAFYHDSLDINDPQHRDISAFRLIAKMPTHRRDGLQVLGRPAVHVPAERPVVRRELHAHDVRACRARTTRSTTCWCARSTASSSCTPTTSRTRRPRRCACARSSGTNPFACIAAGIACLWGPAHGGANEACLNMLDEIQATRRREDRRVHHARSKDKNSRRAS